MKKTKGAPARAGQSSARRAVTKAITDLDRELADSTAPAGTGGPLESPLLVAVANVVLNYVRWRLDKA